MKKKDFVNEWTLVHVSVNFALGIFSGFFYYLFKINLTVILICLILFWELIEQMLISKKFLSYKESNVDVLVDVIIGICFQLIGFYFILYLPNIVVLY